MVFDRLTVTYTEDNLSRHFVFEVFLRKKKNSNFKVTKILKNMDIGIGDWNKNKRKKEKENWKLEYTLEKREKHSSQLHNSHMT